MARTPALALAVALVSLFGAVRASEAQGHKGKKGHSSAAVGFTTAEHDLVVRYYADHRYEAKPLPPGIAKKLARGKPLPPGLAKRALAPDLVTQLPPRQGFEISIIGDRVVLLDTQGLVVDVMVNVFR